MSNRCCICTLIVLDNVKKKKKKKTDFILYPLVLQKRAQTRSTSYKSDTRLPPLYCIVQYSLIEQYFKWQQSVLCKIHYPKYFPALFILETLRVNAIALRVRGHVHSAVDPALQRQSSSGIYFSCYIHRSRPCLLRQT